MFKIGDKVKIIQNPPLYNRDAFIVSIYEHLDFAEVNYINENGNICQSAFHFELLELVKNNQPKIKIEDNATELEKLVKQTYDKAYDNGYKRAIEDIKNILNKSIL